METADGRDYQKGSQDESGRVSDSQLAPRVVPTVPVQIRTGVSESRALGLRLQRSGSKDPY
jgi:hypothetical protein